jgi:copper transport protein
MKRSGAGPRALVVLAGVALAMLAPFAVAPAQAHANLRSSEPANGAVLQTPPSSVVLRFTEAPEPKLALIRVLDTSGTSYERGKPEAVPGDDLALRQAVASLPQGVYTVAWRVVSRTDGHATAGAFAFGVGVSPANVKPSAGVVPKSPPPSVGEIASRWVFIWGLVALVGAAATGLIAFGNPPPSLMRTMWAGLAAAAVGLVGLALAQRAESGVGLGTFLGTNVGRAILWRAAALGGAAAALMVVPRAGSSDGARRGAVGIAGVAGVGAMFAEVAAGHAAAARSLRLLEVGSQWIHFVAVGVWIGGLAALLLGIRGQTDQTKAIAVRRFSATALIAVVAVAVTGGIRALQEVGSWRALFTTSYGRVVLGKVGLLLVLIGLGAMNRYRNVRQADRSLRGLRRVSRIEVSVAAVALLATAILTGSAPPRGATAQAAAGPAAGIAVAGSDFATSLRVRLEVTPGYAGVNTFVAEVTDFDSGQPVRATRVALRFSPLDESGVGQSTLELKPSSKAGHYRASGPNLSLDGRWLVDVLVQQAATSAEVQLQLATRCRVQAVAAPGQPTIYTADLAGGATVQGYLDPGVAGLNEIHFTFFDSAGAELPIDTLPTVTASRGAEAAIKTEVRRFSPGHFISDTQLSAGRWRFQVVAPTGSGTTYQACFEETVRPK